MCMDEEETLSLIHFEVPAPMRSDFMTLLYRIVPSEAIATTPMIGGVNVKCWLTEEELGIFKKSLSLRERMSDCAIKAEVDRFLESFEDEAEL